MNRIPLKWNQLVPVVKAKEEYETSGQALLDQMLKNTVNEMVYGTSDPKKIRRYKQKEIENKIDNFFAPKPTTSVDSFYDQLEQFADLLKNRKKKENPTQ